jgi:hypothetical protein
MRFNGYVKTDKVGSKCEFEFEVEASEVEGMNEEERQKTIENAAREAAFESVEWTFWEV